ncbi:LptF/LptG family permease [Roseospira goensis]|uniref:Lipopolysaccharide export system permease protein n=1 Tax=Roseospira goensis TaxID=391922 RepID=A0A7W6RYB8_9PROT|nr:LptF/LptG family permease [Roseospira goensis]MBB4285484.1 lipopolysaccharide export system permease protein [Roseospira goensis]
MRLVLHYVLRQLVIALVLGTTALMVLLWLIHSLRFFDAFLNKGLPVGTFLTLTVLLMPGFLTFFLPIALFAVILFVYHRMIVDRELMVLQAAGLSRWQIGAPALALAAALCGLGYYLTLDAVPRLERAFNALRFEIRHEISRLALTEGAFTEISDTLTIYVRNATERGDLEGLIIHDRSDPDITVTITARRGALVYDQGQPRVMMVKGVRQERDRASGRVSFLFFDRHSMAVADRDAEGMVRVPESRERTTVELFTLTTEDQMAPNFPHTFTEGNVRRMRMEGHQRLAKPLANVSFALVALGALLAGEFNRQGRNRRIVVAVAAVVLAQATTLGAANLARSDLTWLPLLYVGPLGTMALGLWWLLRYPRPGSAGSGTAGGATAAGATEAAA